MAPQSLCWSLVRSTNTPGFSPQTLIWWESWSIDTRSLQCEETLEAAVRIDILRFLNI